VVNVAITGATGFVGSYAIPRLLEAGHRVRAFVRPARDTRSLEAAGVEVCRGEMTDEVAMRALVKGVDAVIHTAYSAASWDETRQLDHLRQNILGSAMLLELARLAGVGQFICTVSTYVLRPDVEKPEDVSNTPVDEDSPWVPAWRTYVTHNVALESACQAYSSQFGMRTTRFRCAWIYGLHPKPELTVWRDILEAVRNGETYDRIFGCDVVCVHDVAAALTAAVGNENAFDEVFNLSEIFVYNEEVAKVAREVVGSSAQIVEHKMPRPAAINSEKVKRLGVELCRGMTGIREYLTELSGAV